MKFIKYVFIIIIVFVLGCSLTYIIMSKVNSSNKVEITSSNIVHQIEQLGKLEVAKYNIQTMLEYTKNRNNILPNGRTILEAHGEVVACIDFSKIRKESININKDTITITLPNPEICQVSLSQEKSKVHDISFGLWDTGEIVQEAYKYAEVELKKSAKEINLNNEAKTNASTLIRAFLQTLGFKEVHIQYEVNKNIKN